MNDAARERERARGHIELICGSMFSGKTEELIRRLKRAEIARQRVQVFSHTLDTRYGESKVASHNGVDRLAIPLFVKRADLVYAAVAEMGIPMGDAELIVVENSKDVHNVIVCTLCSCYPWAVLGLPPLWYKSAPYRSRTVAEPRSVLREFGVELPDDTEIRVWDSTAELRYLVIPMRPDGTDDWSEEQLADLVTRDSMIGTGVVKRPQELS